MFGSKLKTWMENYIGRGKKKEKPKANERGGVILESSESLAQSDTGISSSSQQVLSSSTTDNREGYSTTTMESERSGMTQTHTAISLPSPESAYSTGYSTDGASPGTTGPPEYYINIRTGKHYFPSPAPTPTSPQPKNDILQIHTENQPLPNDPSRSISHTEREFSSSSSTSSCAKIRVQSSSRFSNGFPSQVDHLTESSPRQNTLSPPINEFETSKCLNKKLTSLKLFLKSPKNERVSPTDSKKNQITNGKSRKWFKQPFQKFGQRRADERVLEGDKRKTHFEKNVCYFLTQENSASPRQRNRIKTNPWLPTEPLSSQNFHNLTFSPMLTRNRSCSNTPLQNRKTNHQDLLQNRILQLNSKYEESRDYLESLEKAVSRHLVGNAVVESSDLSEEDLTLNEMMGTYNESYVYEKETDILSDSDPTDCEDYGTDSEANNGGDERDSHDDELDFIDNGSVIESDDNYRNTGKCTYYDGHIKKNSFLLKTDRHHSRRGSECRKNSKKDQRREKRRQPRKSFKRDDDEKVKKTLQKIEVDGGLNLKFHRMMAKGSKSAEGTPITGRRDKVTKGGVKTEEKILSLYLGDAEADIKYKELIEEAENMFESMRNSPGCKINERTFQKSCSDKQQQPVKKNPRDLGLKLSETPKKLKRLNFDAKSQPKAHSPLDPLGPNLKNFSIFKPVLYDDRKITKCSEECEKEREIKWGGVSPSTIVPIAFQSIDLGKPLTSYCPQSEPVKRKIYTCSKTYDKLVKRFENKQTIFEENISNRTNSPNSLNGKQGTSPRNRLYPPNRCSINPLINPHINGDIFKRNSFTLDKKNLTNI